MKEVVVPKPIKIEVNGKAKNFIEVEAEVAHEEEVVPKDVEVDLIR